MDAVQLANKIIEDERQRLIEAEVHFSPDACVCGLEFPPNRDGLYTCPCGRLFIKSEFSSFFVQVRTGLS